MPPKKKIEDLQPFYKKECDRPAEWLNWYWMNLADENDRLKILKRLKRRDKYGRETTFCRQYYKDKILKDHSDHRGLDIDWCQVLFKAHDERIPLEDIELWHADRILRYRQNKPSTLRRLKRRRVRLNKAAAA